jgi:CRISPR-associated exonuclease Cas4
MDEPVDPLPLSALQHWCYCPRQCALIHIEQLFDDNVYTLRGHAVHAQVDKPGVEVRAGLRVERALQVFSEHLGLTGKADVVEFEPDGTPYPVEYKHGRRSKSAAFLGCDTLQLAAQAMCLEEMTGRGVPEGALFYASSKRRQVVSITSDLRAQVKEAASAVRSLVASGRLPPPVYDAKCRHCSLIDACQPQAFDKRRLHAARRALFDPDS